MSRLRRRIVAIVALLVVGSMAFGVGGYSSLSVERNVTVSVVSSENAYLGISDELQCDGENDFIRNQFGDDTTIDSIEIEVTTVDGSVRVGTDGAMDQLESGESTELTFQGPYESGASAAIRIKPPSGNASGAAFLEVELLDVSGTDVTVSGARRTYDVNCPDGEAATEGNADQ
ncbi:hypothetical protein ACERIT_01105 [Halopenitus sp. H-Gu1]|uniref:hypothetical protein n=1 Tax=Halopenitus sp. H-Gu1 TaxID=3242697 RepID=UPI00359EB003